MVRAPLHFHGRIPVPEVAPLTYRDGVTQLELVYELSQYLKNILHPSLQSAVNQVVADAERLLSEANAQYVDGVQEFQRIHDAFMSDVNAHLMALNDSAVSDLVVDDSSLLSTILRNTYSNTAINVQTRGIFPDGEPINDRMNALIDDHPGHTFVFPPGEYTVTATQHGVHLSQPGTAIRFEPGAKLVLETNNLARYALIYVDASDCRIDGGVLVGDVQTHTGTSGEWGMGIYVASGGDNLTIRGTESREMWGDGIYIGGGATNILLDNLTALRNRRQGLSMSHAENVTVRGGSYSETGFYNATLPSAGVDLEPNPGRGESLRNITLEGVETTGNVGTGILVMAAGEPVEVNMFHCVSHNNQRYGFYLNSSVSAQLFNCAANHNDLDGVLVYYGSGAASPTVSLIGFSSQENTRFGMQIVGENTQIINPVVKYNGSTGIAIFARSDNSSVVGGETIGNGQLSSAPNINVGAEDVRIVSHVSRGGQRETKPSVSLQSGQSTLVALNLVEEGDFNTTGGNYHALSTVIPRLRFTERPQVPWSASDLDSCIELVNELRSALASYGVVR